MTFPKGCVHFPSACSPISLIANPPWGNLYFLTQGGRIHQLELKYLKSSKTASLNCGPGILWPGLLLLHFLLQFVQPDVDPVCVAAAKKIKVYAWDHYERKTADNRNGIIQIYGAAMFGILCAVPDASPRK